MGIQINIISVVTIVSSSPDSNFDIVSAFGFKLNVFWVLVTAMGSFGAISEPIINAVIPPKRVGKTIFNIIATKNATINAPTVAKRIPGRKIPFKLLELFKKPKDIA